MRHIGPANKTALLLCAAISAALAANADLYVDASASADGADGTEAKPYPTIQAAVNSASASDVIRVAEGVYTNGSGIVSGASHARVYINGKPGLKIIGAGRGKSFIVGSRDPSATIYDDTLTETRTNLISCVYARNSAGAVVEGFTLKDGESFYNADGVGSRNGGGVCEHNENIDGIYLVDCDILHCCARVGGAMKGGTAVRCRFERNYGMSGAVARNSRLVNCLVSGSRAPSSSGSSPPA